MPPNTPGDPESFGQPGLLLELSRVYSNNPAMQWEALKLLRLLAWARGPGPGNAGLQGIQKGPLFDHTGLGAKPRLSQVAKILGHARTTQAGDDSDHLDIEWFGMTSPGRRTWSTPHASQAAASAWEDLVMQTLIQALEKALGIAHLDQPDSPQNWSPTTCPAVVAGPAGNLGVLDPTPPHIRGLNRPESLPRPIDFWWIAGDAIDTFEAYPVYTKDRVAVIFRTPAMSQ